MDEDVTKSHRSEVVGTSFSNPGWRELWSKEDWWAIWLGVGIVIIGCVLYANGSSLRWIAVTPAKWSNLAELGTHFVGNFERYCVQFLLWTLIFSVALTVLGFRAREFIPSFLGFLAVILCFCVVLGDFEAMSFPVNAVVMGNANMTVPAQSPPVCRFCAEFCNHPRLLEKLIQGLTSFGSADALVLGDDGICKHHNRLSSASSFCSDFKYQS